MKKIILLVALTSLSFIIKAQTCFGVHTGLNYSTFSEIKEPVSYTHLTLPTKLEV